MYQSIEDEILGLGKPKRPTQKVEVQAKEETTKTQQYSIKKEVMKTEKVSTHTNPRIE